MMMSPGAFLRWPDETQSFEIPEYFCGGYGLLQAVRLGLLFTAAGAVGYVIGKEICEKVLTSLFG